PARPRHHRRRPDRLQHAERARPGRRRRGWRPGPHPDPAARRPLRPGRQLMLVAEGLRKRYRQREVVREFGLTLDAGEVVGLLGPNGAGKTTCFYMIVGLVPADAGRIVLDGRDIT